MSCAVDINAEMAIKTAMELVASKLPPDDPKSPYYKKHMRAMDLRKMSPQKSPEPTPIAEDVMPEPSAAPKLETTPESLSPSPVAGSANAEPDAQAGTAEQIPDSTDSAGPDEQTTDARKDLETTED